MKLKNINFSNIIEYLSLFFIIYLTSSFVSISSNGTIILALLLINSLFVFLVKFKNIKINIKGLLLLIYILVASMLTMIINSDGLYEYLIFWAAIISAYLMYISISIDKFIKIFNNIMHFLCVFSLLSFSIIIFVPSFIELFPLFVNSEGVPAYNLFFSVVYNSSYFHRNFGLFWEPGSYQVFINLALFFQLYIIKPLNIKRICIFVVTIFTTFSSTGFICTILLIFSYFLFSKNENQQNKRRKKYFFIISIFILFLSIISLSLLPKVILFNIFGKMEALFNFNLLSNPSYLSALSRVDAVIIALKSAINNPLFGIGFSKLTNEAVINGSGFTTATTINWFGLFGFLYGIIMCYLLWLWCKKVRGSVSLKILLFIFLVLITLSENFNKNAFYLLFLFYAIENSKNLLNQIDRKLQY